MQTESAMPTEITTTDIDKQALEKEARRRVRRLKGFYAQAVVYAIVNVLLVVLNLLFTPEYFWAMWPLLGCGVALLVHAVQVFGLFGVGGREWEERKVQEYIMQRQSGLSAAEVKKLMHDELQNERAALSTSAELERMRQRLEHLEAIVTSEDWDRVRVPELERRPLKLEIDSEPESAADEAARLARRVR